MSAPAPRILFADDQPDVLEALRFLLKPEGYATEAVKSPSAAIKAVEARDFDLALIDLNYTRDTTSGAEGLELLAKLQLLDPSLPVVVMTAWASVDLAVEAMRRGAKDFIIKPWDNPRLLTIVKTQLELVRTVRAYKRMAEENQLLRGSDKKGPSLIAQSAAMRPVLEIVSRVGPSDANVLITGENGTGKGLIAQALHSVSARSENPFISVNMGGLPEGVFESELFGHVRGAFTDAKTDRAGRWELADGGTLFLDEIGNIPLTQQAKILRTIERGEFERVGSSRTHRANVRLVSATNSDLESEVAAGRFRQDLLFRLNTIQIHLPPLRERREDIELLAQHFLQQHAMRYRKAITGFDPSAAEVLRSYSWPGNVRELDHAVERGVLMCPGKAIRAVDLGLNASKAAPSLEEMSLDEVESFLIKKTLSRCDGNARQAAEVLGLSRSAFYRRLEKHGL
ncbi:MAG: sigma-54 dependent transcriptional regulator [Opitutaceae bacterium]|jgi:DNA-binding NtrC family response regulator